MSPVFRAQQTAFGASGRGKPRPYRGGGATGYFAMGQKAHGKYALGLNRQGQEAIDFFRRYVPGLRNAMTNPMPVILLDRREQRAEVS